MVSDYHVCIIPSSKKIGAVFGAALWKQAENYAKENGLVIKTIHQVKRPAVGDTLDSIK